MIKLSISFCSSAFIILATILTACSDLTSSPSDKTEKTSANKYLISENIPVKIVPVEEQSRDKALPILKVERDEKNTAYSENSPSREPYLTEQEITLRLAEIGPGPYKIGTTEKGYFSRFLKEVFELYDGGMEFTENRNSNSGICDFTKATVFSDELNLSHYYWHHPKNTEWPVQKIEDGAYQLNANPSLRVVTSITDNFIPSTNSPDLPQRSKSVSLEASTFGICNMGEVVKLGGGSRCTYEYAIDQRESGVGNVFDWRTPGSTIGFFLYEHEIYITSVQLFYYRPISSITTGGYPTSHVAVQTNRVVYNAETLDIEAFHPVCVYDGNPITD